MHASWEPACTRSHAGFCPNRPVAKTATRVLIATSVSPGTCNFASALRSVNVDLSLKKFLPLLLIFKDLYELLETLFLPLFILFYNHLIETGNCVKNKTFLDFYIKIKVFF